MATTSRKMDRRAPEPYQTTQVSWQPRNGRRTAGKLGIAVEISPAAGR